MPARCVGAWIGCILVAVWLFGTFSCARAQNLVINGGFGGGSVDGWTTDPFIGDSFVNVPGSAQGGLGDWISFSGTMWQDLPTVPGQSYLVSFADREYNGHVEHQEPLRILQASWGNQLIAYDVFRPGTVWFRRQLVLTAEANLTRLRLDAWAHPSLDDVAVVPVPLGQPLATSLSPTNNARFLEGDNILLNCDPEVAVGRALVKIEYFESGVVPLGVRTSAPFSTTWTNVPAGSYFISARVTDSWGSNTISVPSAVTVLKRPAVEFLTPENEAVLTNGQNITVRAVVTNNPGTIRRLDIFVETNLLRSTSAITTNATLSTTWSNVSRGNYTLSAVGRDAAGMIVSEAKVVVHVLPPPVLDQYFSGGGGAIDPSPGQTYAQTFTPQWGGRIHNVGLGLVTYAGSEYMPVRIKITDTVNGLPGTNILAQVTRPAYDTSIIYFPSNDIYLAAGEVYAFIASFPDPPVRFGLRMWENINEEYVGGRPWLLTTNGSWTPLDVNGVGDIQIVVWVSTNARPSIALTQPGNGEKFGSGADIPLAANAQDGEGDAVWVDFYRDAVFLGRSEHPPYTFVLSNAPPGNYSITAQAQDGHGAPTVSPPATILVGADRGLPRLSISDAVIAEGAALGTTNCFFTVQLSSPTTDTVTVGYASANGLAVAPHDYTPVFGTVTFPPLATNATVVVQVRGDSILEPDETFSVNLFRATNAVIVRGQGTCTIIDDEFTADRLHHFTWDPTPAAASAGGPIPVTVRARDILNRSTTNVIGPVKLSLGLATTNTQNRIIGSNNPTVTARFGTYTIGYSFTPNTDLLVTHFRYYSGSKVSLWTEDGALLATVNVTPHDSGFLETPLPAPVKLVAGRTYRLGYYTAGGFDNHGWRTDSANSFQHGTIHFSWSYPGDAFPSIGDSELWPSVDIRYTIESVQYEALQPAQIPAFSNGVWFGAVTVLTNGTAYLRAEDVAGHIGLSSPLNISPSADLAVFHEPISPSNLTPGQHVVYKVRTQNSGPSRATSVRLTNTWSGSVTFVSASHPGCVYTNGQLVCDLGDLASGGVADVLVDVVPTQSGFLTNDCSVRGTETDLNPGNNFSRIATLVNAHPVVDIISPTNGARLVFAPILPIVATAVDADGSVQRVEFFDGTNRLGAIESAPFVFAWSNAPLGVHHLSALAVDDRGAEAASSTSSVNIIFVNVAPTFTGGSNQVVLEDAPLQTVPGWARNLSAGPPFESGQRLTFTVSNDNPGLFDSVPAIDATGTLTYAPAPDAEGSATVTVWLRDDGGVGNGGQDTSSPHIFTISVLAVNDPPVFIAGANQIIFEDAGPQSRSGWATGIAAGPASEVDQSLRFIVSHDAPGLFLTAPAITASGTLTYMATPNANGVALVSVTLRDDAGTANGGIDSSAPQFFRITIIAVNDAPAAVPQVLSTDEDTPLRITLSGSDVDGDALLFTVATPPAHGVLTGSGAVREYVPAANYFGPDSFSFKASDGQTSSFPAAIRIDVRPVDDAPVAVISILSPLLRLFPDQTDVLLLAPDSSNSIVVLDGSFSRDIEDDPLEFVWLEHGIPFATGARITNSFAVGEHTVALQATDGVKVGSAEISFTIVSPSDAIETVIQGLNDSDFGSRNKRPLIASLKAAMASFDRGNRNAGVNQLHAAQNKIRAQLASRDPALAASLIEAIQRIIDQLDR